MKDTFAKYASLIRNSAFNLGGQSIAVLAALICVPITFRLLGTERFGLLTLVWSMLSYAIVFDLGTGPAVARATAASIVSDDGRRIAAIVRAGMTIQIVIGVCAGLLVAVLAPTLLSLLKVPVVYRDDAQLALYALAVCLPVVLITQSMQAVLEGLERFDLIAYVRTPVAVATYAIPAIGAVAGWSLAHIMVLIAASRFVAVLVMNGMYRAALPPGQHGVMKHELPALFKFGRWLAISGVLAQLLMYLDRFLLSGMHGLNAVAQYAAPYDATTKLLVIPGSIGVAMFPGLTKDAARERVDEAVTRSHAAGRLTMLLLLPAVLVLLILAGPILHLWLGPTIGAQGIAAFRFLLVATVFHAAAYPPIILLEALGRSDTIARYNVAELLVYLPVVLYAVWRYGVVGAAGAWVLRSGALMIWSLWYARRYVSRTEISKAQLNAAAN